MEIEIDEEHDEMRLDRFLRKQFGQLAQGVIEGHLRSGHIRVDKNKVKSGYRLASGERLIVPDDFHAITTQAAKQAEIRSRTPCLSMTEMADTNAILAAKQKLESLILSQTDNWLALNKPAGLAVQGGTNTKQHIDGMLCAAWPDNQPKLVHRIDKDTSGLLLVARNASTARMLTKAFKEHLIQKIYLALVIGNPGAEGVISAPLRKAGGRGCEKMIVDRDAGLSAKTNYQCVACYGPVSLVILRPLTGRTHQLRVHMADLGTPILGDGKYAGAGAHIDGFSRQLHLHAWALRLEDGTELSAPLSPHFNSALTRQSVNEADLHRHRSFNVPGKIKRHI